MMLMIKSLKLILQIIMKLLLEQLLLILNQEMNISALELQT